MLKLIVQRLIFSVITLTIVAVVVFAMTDLLPGDWATAYFGKWATPEGLAAMREEYGLNRPATERFAEWVGNALRGEFGDSLTRKKPVVELISFRLRNSLLLGGLASLVTIPLATLLGITAGLRRDRAPDTIISTGSIVGMSTPEFVIGTLLIWALSVGLGLFPSMTLGNPDAPIADLLPNVVMPTITLTLASTAYLLRMVRTITINVLTSEYVEMATLKGLPRARVVFRHALPNILLPTINIMALMLSGLLGGTFVVEVVFNYPGLGRALVDAVSFRDVPMIQAIALLWAVMYVFFNLGADLVTTFLDPRLRSLRG
ncbi:MAG: ABC transporter permease [Chloroflexota bacterium]|nr:ABC transporter permease [Chloroflexota bacterium]MDE2907592.1 ABC transporter permease [Chloroflexota bacterium]